MTFVDLENLDHAPDLAAALGNMVVAWARAETALVKAYALVTKLHYNEAASAYYNIPTFEARTKVLAALIAEIQSHAPFAAAAPLDTAIAALVDLSKTRNEWVHAVWVCYPNASPVFTLNMKQSSKRRRVKQITATAVSNHVQAVTRQRRAIEALCPTKIALRPPSPRKS